MRWPTTSRMPLVPNRRTPSVGGVGQIIPTTHGSRMDEPRWLVDEMLGRLSRYLRFLGYDTEYVHGLTDAEVVRLAHTARRRVLTRDRSLARSLPDSILLTRTDLAGQMQELRRNFPPLRLEVRFDRCSECNGPLSRLPGPPGDRGEDRTVPAEVREGRAPVFACSVCGHLYWEGSHTRSVRARLASWFPVEVL